MHLLHDRNDLLFLVQDASDKLFRRQMCDVFLGRWVLAVKVAAIGQDFHGWNLPCMLVYFPAVPPCQQSAKFFILERLGLRVVLAAFWQWLGWCWQLSLAAACEWENAPSPGLSLTWRQLHF